MHAPARGGNPLSPIANIAKARIARSIAERVRQP
jgi:hypothetical protein